MSADHSVLGGLFKSIISYVIMLIKFGYVQYLPIIWRASKGLLRDTT